MYLLSVPLVFSLFLGFKTQKNLQRSTHFNFKDERSCFLETALQHMVCNRLCLTATDNKFHFSVPLSGGLCNCSAQWNTTKTIMCS